MRAIILFLGVLITFLVTPDMVICKAGLSYAPYVRIAGSVLFFVGFMLDWKGEKNT